MLRATFVVARIAIEMAGEGGGETEDVRASLHGGTEAQTRLRDGRRLAYVVHGDDAGPAVLLEHGTPGSRLGLGSRTLRRASAASG